MLTKIKNFWGTKKGKILIIAVLVLLVAGLAGGGYYAYWYGQQPKFQNLTIELGRTDLSVEDFHTQYAKEGKTAFVTDLEQVDLSLVGEHPITLSQGKKEETVLLIIEDTTAPTAEFQDIIAYIDYIPKPEEFVVTCDDLSGTEVSFAVPLSTPEDYGDAKVEVIVSDPYGNRISQECTIRYVWMRETFTLELGDTLTKADLLLNPEDEELIAQEDIDAINASPVGEYTVSSTVEERTLTCNVTVQDTRGPEVKLRAVTVYIGGNATLKDFLESATDPSGNVKTELTTKPDCTKEGTQKIKVTATDPLGNQTVAETTLKVIRDTIPPEFSGVSEMTVAKHSSPNYEAGVKAVDGKDGQVPFTVDASGVNTSVAGTYYVVYSATDSAGNRGTYKRKVVVNHDAEDTTRLVQEFAANVGNDPMAIKIYVRDNIKYNSNWGGDDPVWYGLTKRTGNCYVHALVLQRVLSLKGYRTQLIWTTEKTHYWLLIDMGGYWRHIDATPGASHGNTGLMTDSERLARLSGRTWDTTKWPACE